MPWLPNKSPPTTFAAPPSLAPAPQPTALQPGEQASLSGIYFLWLFSPAFGILPQTEIHSDIDNLSHHL